MFPGPEEIAEAVRRLRAGGVVAFPTETVYGLGALALDEAAVRRVYALKGRPARNPLIVHVADTAGARALAREWGPDAQRLAEALWPGPLTIVVPRAPAVPAIVTGGGGTVAIRCPDHPVALTLLSALDAPLVGPSANPSGRVSPTTAQHVREAFPSDDVLVLDGGPCTGGIESTVLSVAEPTPRILRPGPVSPEQIEALLRRPVESDWGDRPADAGPLPAPGMLPAHYAPAAPLRLCDADGPPPEMPAGGEVVFMAVGPVPGWAGSSRVHVVEMPGDAPAYAARLYAALREADARNPAIILVARPGIGSDEPLWRAVMDRLHRAAGRGGA